MLFMRLPTSFDKSVRYEVLSFACLTVNKASWVQGEVATPLGPKSLIFSFSSGVSLPHNAGGWLLPLCI